MALPNGSMNLHPLTRGQDLFSRSGFRFSCQGSRIPSFPVNWISISIWQSLCFLLLTFANIVRRNHGVTVPLKQIFLEAFLRYILRRGRTLSSLDASLEERLWVLGIPGARASIPDHGIDLLRGVSCTWRRSVWVYFWLRFANLCAPI